MWAQDSKRSEPNFRIPEKPGQRTSCPAPLPWRSFVPRLRLPGTLASPSDLYSHSPPRPRRLSLSRRPAVRCFSRDSLFRFMCFHGILIGNAKNDGTCGKFACSLIWLVGYRPFYSMDLTRINPGDTRMRICKDFFWIVLYISENIPRFMTQFYFCFRGYSHEYFNIHAYSVCHY